MTNPSHYRLQLVVFALVSASFANIYITQPVLPVIQHEFSADTLTVSFTISAVLLGIALANLPFGALSDHYPMKPILLISALSIAAAGMLCAYTDDLWVLIGARFVQGIFIPGLTTCLAAYLARTLPLERLNVVMGSYVSATVLGGLISRLLGGWIHPPFHWRYAFVSAAVFIMIATFVALRYLPASAAKTQASHSHTSFLSLVKRRDLLLMFICGAASFAVFSPIFNYLPYRLGAEPFNLSTEITTLIYFTYVMGIMIGPASGRISNRFGNGNTLIAGSLLLAISVSLLLLPSLVAVVISLLGICTGFFTVHAAAVGGLNKKLSHGHGRANALYVLFYYLGGWISISWSGLLYQSWGWNAVVYSALLTATIPFAIGMLERSGRLSGR